MKKKKLIKLIYELIFVLLTCDKIVCSKRKHELSLWIDEVQVRRFSGFPMEIHIISEGQVQPYLLDPNFEDYLPVIPPEVQMVNFTWTSGERRKYFYNFDRLQSSDLKVLDQPSVSIQRRGKIPRRPKSFTIFLSCTPSTATTTDHTPSKIAQLTIGLLIETRKGRPLQGTPLRFKLRKMCDVQKPNSSHSDHSDECHKKCENGYCSSSGFCVCREGYLGLYCQRALCYPKCLNGGECVAPGKCDCRVGFHGDFCEGGICSDKCLNGGKCVQKDTCECTKGYYGLRCEYSKCMIPCLNGGKCRGVNTCRCPVGFTGEHCEIELTQSNRSISQRHTCKVPCRHGICGSEGKCICEEGWVGKRCGRGIFV